MISTTDDTKRTGRLMSAQKNVLYPTIEASMTPFRHLILRNLVSEGWAADLEEDIATLMSAKASIQANRADKQYRMKFHSLVEGGRSLEPTIYLDSRLQEFFTALAASSLITICERHAGLLPGTYTMDAGVYTFESGHFISEHLDKPKKALTAVLYLNTDWSASDGGAFVFHDTDGTPHHKLIPEYGTAIVFQPSDKSLHSVERVSRPPELAPRLTVQLEFYAA